MAAIVAAAFYTSRSLAQTSSTERQAISGSGGTLWHSRPGPWGELEISSLYLEAPDAQMEGIRHPSTTISWHFPNATEASIGILLDQAGLANEQQKRLLNPNRILLHEGVWTLFPEPVVVAALTIGQRSIIYRELAKSSLNPMHESPAYVTGNRVDDWLRDARLSPAAKESVRHLLWKDGDLLAFSDVSLLLAQATSDDEILHIIKFMTRVRALMVELKLTPDADVNVLARYWTGAGMVNDGVPLLTSEAEAGHAATIDITHLLPSLPRKLLYTYPTLASAAAGRLPDCQWTAFNFFNTEPCEYYLDTRLSVTHLRDAYQAVEPPYQLGDVLELVTTEGSALHGCVYIADDIVFTKNGDGMVRPWVLMWLSDVENLYMREPGMRVMGHRLKPAGRPNN